MAPTKITFNDHNATPPVYVAGTFTSWEPVEIEAKQGEDGFTYEKTFDLTPGTHQYKFRLGPGDWWVCDNQTQKTVDASGNENNEIVIKADPFVKSEPVAKAESVIKSVPAPTSLISSAATVLNGTSEPKTAKSLEPTKSISTPVVKASETSETPEPKVNGSAKAAVESTKPEHATEKVNGIQQESAPATKETIVAQTAPAPAKAISEPSNEKVEAKATSTPAAKDSDSKESSISSMAPKEKVNEPKKLDWFSRIFLCGSSGK